MTPADQVSSKLECIYALHMTAFVFVATNIDSFSADNHALISRQLFLNLNGATL